MFRGKIKIWVKGRFADLRPSLPAFAKGKSNRRARKLEFNLLASDFSLSFRKFSTKPNKRTQLKKQKVIKLGLFGYKELAITLEHTDLPPLNINLPTVPARVVMSFVLALGLSGILVFSLNLTSPRKLVPVAKSYAQTPTPTVQKTLSMAASEPNRLVISKIDLDSPVQPIGLMASGALDVPTSPDVTGWYNKSPTPGEVGPSIIDGHVDYIDNIAVFWRLRELVPGDAIEVYRADGSIAKFSVDEVKQYPQESFNSNEVYGKINYAGLRLITCSGTFNTATGHYSDNLVVFASLSSK